jgi:hypothetical protein
MSCTTDGVPSSINPIGIEVILATLPDSLTFYTLVSSTWLSYEFTDFGTVFNGTYYFPRTFPGCDIFPRQVETFSSVTRREHATEITVPDLFSCPGAVTGTTGLTDVEVYFESSPSLQTTSLNHIFRFFIRDDYSGFGVPTLMAAMQLTSGVVDSCDTTLLSLIDGPSVRPSACSVGAGILYPGQSVESVV